MSVLSVTFVHCGQTVGGIKMKLGTQVDLGPDHIVLGGDPAPSPQKGGRAPQIFGPYCGQTAGRMKLVVGMEVGLSPYDFVLDGDPVPFFQKGAEPPVPNFRPTSIVAKRLHASKCHLVYSYASAQATLC